MPLDFTVIEDERRAGAISSLGAREHAALMGQARALGLPLLQRFADFASDAEVALPELPALAPRWWRRCTCCARRSPVPSAWARRWLRSRTERFGGGLGPGRVPLEASARAACCLRIAGVRER